MHVELQPKLPISEAFEPGYLDYNGILPLEITDGHLRVAVAGEPAVEVLDDLERTFQAQLDLVPVSRDDLSDAIRRIYSAAASTVELIRDLDDDIEGIHSLGRASPGRCTGIIKVCQFMGR